MVIVYCTKLSDLPNYPLMQMFDDKPGWEAKAEADKRLDTRKVYKFHASYWIPFKNSEVINGS
jgi:hypothetical protein